MDTLGHYFRAVLQKALEPTRALTEIAVALLAFAIPVVAFSVGAGRMPSTDTIFGWVGVGIVCAALLRILLVAPWQAWRDQTQTIEKLRQELSEPERRELAHMANVRAEKRLELAAELRQFHWLSWTVVEHGNRQKFNDQYGRLLGLLGQVGAPQNFNTMFGRFSGACSRMNRARRVDKDNNSANDEAMKLLEDMTDYLHGRLTADQLVVPIIETQAELEASGEDESVAIGTVTEKSQSPKRGDEEKNKGGANGGQTR